MAAGGWGRYEVGARRGDDFRPSPIFLAIVALFVGTGLLVWFKVGLVRFELFLFVVFGWIVSLCLHEYSHALLAYKGGDVSVASRGYLRLNPLKYAHPVLSIILPVVFLLLGGIGLPGGAVWIDRHAVRSRRAESWISAAGPAANLVFGLVLAVPFLVGVDIYPHPEFWAGVAALGFLQVTAALLNILPIPGLDGGNIMRPWLTSPWDRRFDLFAPYGMLILFALLFQPRANQLFFGVVELVCNLIGVPYGLSQAGLAYFRFWD